MGFFDDASSLVNALPAGLAQVLQNYNQQRVQAYNDASQMGQQGLQSVPLPTDLKSAAMFLPKSALRNAQFVGGTLGEIASPLTAAFNMAHNTAASVGPGLGNAFDVASMADPATAAGPLAHVAPDAAGVFGALAPKLQAFAGDESGALNLTKKAQWEALKAQSGFLDPQIKPIVSQAGERGLPLGGPEQMALQHTGGYSPFAKIAPRTPEADVSATYQAMPGMGAPSTFDPAQLENAHILPLYGDRSIAGQRLTNLNGMPLDVNLYGGPRYAEMNAALGSPAAWASEKAPIGTLRGRIAEALEKGAPNVYGVYTAMGPRSLDQSTMMTDALLQQTAKSPILKKDIKAFDQQIKADQPDFPGVLSPKVQDYLQGTTQGNRLKFVQSMDAADWQKAGFPDVASTRVALTEPGLRQMPGGSSGFSVVKFDPNSLKNFEPTLVHPTYPVQMTGTPMGGMANQVPFDMLYPQFFAARRAAGATAGRDLRALEMAKPIEQLAPQGFDRLMQYLDSLKK